MDDTKILMLNLQAGDVLVVKVNDIISQEQALVASDIVKAKLAQAGHLDIPILVIDRGISLEVLRVEGVTGVHNKT